MNGPSHSTLLERIDGLDEARVFRVDEADLGHQQHARVEVLAAEALDEGLAALAPGTARGSWRGSCRRAPRQMRRAFGRLPRTAAILASRSQAAQHISDDEVCTRARVRSSHMPASGWSWKRQACSPIAFERGEVARVGATEQAMVEERLRRAENDVAVDVVLEVLVGLVADAHRTHAAVARPASARSLSVRVCSRPMP